MRPLQRRLRPPIPAPLPLSMPDTNQPLTLTPISVNLKINQRTQHGQLSFARSRAALGVLLDAPRFRLELRDAQWRGQHVHHRVARLLEDVPARLLIPVFDYRGKMTGCRTAASQ